MLVSIKKGMIIIIVISNGLSKGNLYRVVSLRAVKKIINVSGNDYQIFVIIFLIFFDLRFYVYRVLVANFSLLLEKLLAY